MAVVIIIFGGSSLFPATKFLFKIIGVADVVSENNPLNNLAKQTAFIIPMLLPLVFFIGAVDGGLFVPSIILIIGVHYMQFITFYGSKFFGLVAGIFIELGYLLFYFPVNFFTFASWLASGIYYILAIVMWINISEGYKLIESSSLTN